MMMLIEQTAVADATLPLGALHEHLRLGSGFGDESVQEALLAGYLRAALAAIEGRTAKALLTRRFLWSLDAWRDPAGQGQALPLAPVVAVGSVTMLDIAGVAVVVDPARWRLQRDAHRPRLVPVGGALPTIPDGGVAEVVFDAGFGPGWDDLPADLRQAVLLLAAHFHEFRHEGGFESGAMPFGVLALIERWRTVRVLGGGAR